MSSATARASTRTLSRRRSLPMTPSFVRMRTSTRKSSSPSVSCDLVLEFRLVARSDGLARRGYRDGPSPRAATPEAEEHVSHRTPSPSRLTRGPSGCIARRCSCSRALDARPYGPQPYPKRCVRVGVAPARADPLAGRRIEHHRIALELLAAFEYLGVASIPLRILGSRAREMKRAHRLSRLHSGGRASSAPRQWEHDDRRFRGASPHRALRRASRARRADRSVRRLRDAGAVFEHPQRARSGAASRGAVRPLAHGAVRIARRRRRRRGPRR